MADLTIHDVPKVKEGLLQAAPSNKIARDMVEVCHIAIAQESKIRRLTTALREAKPALLRAVNLNRDVTGLSGHPEAGNDAAALRALAEMEESDG